MAEHNPTDAAVLERAAAIITERSTKPDSISTRAFVKVLRNQAAAIRAEVMDRHRENISPGESTATTQKRQTER